MHPIQATADQVMSFQLSQILERGRGNLPSIPESPLKGSQMVLARAIPLLTLPLHCPPPKKKAKGNPNLFPSCATQFSFIRIMEPTPSIAFLPPKYTPSRCLVTTSRPRQCPES